MSKLMVIPNKKEDINIILNKDIEGIILGVKDLSIYELSLDIDDIIEIASTTDKKICIAINKMIHNSDLELVKEVLSKIKNSKVSGILFYDLGVFNLIKKLDIDKELILSQEHLNASTKSNLFYYNKGIKSSYITSDITFDEIRKIKENTKMNIYYTVYGYLPIFYSRRLLLTNYFKYIDKENIETWENSINIWEQSFLDLSYISNLIQIEKTVNIDGRILEDLKNAVDSNESRSAINITKKVDKIYDLDINEFKKLCKNIITTKLSYIITQEYEDKFNDTNKDELNFLAYDVKGSKRELTLISFKRWRKTSIGELMVRDFFMLINEVDAKNGILIVPNELSNSARSYVFHNDRIIVYARDQFNNLLNNLIKD